MFASEKIVQNGVNLHVEYGNDQNIYVEFEKKPVQQMFLTEQEGRPVFHDVPFITMMFAGDKTKVINRPVEEEDKHRFKRQWEAFQAGENQPINGTPLSEWTILSKSEVAEFKALNIHTIEALSAIPDSALSWTGARTRRDQAIAFLKNHGVEIAKRDAEIDELKKQVAELMARTSESSIDNSVKTDKVIKKQ